MTDLAKIRAALQSIIDGIDAAPEHEPAPGHGETPPAHPAPEPGHDSAPAPDHGGTPTPHPAPEPEPHPTPSPDPIPDPAPDPSPPATPLPPAGGKSAGFVGELLDCAIVNHGYDALKLAGGVGRACRIEGNYFAPPVYYGGAPHYDAFTITGSEGGMLIRNNLIDMSLTNGGVGVNNAFQFAPYWDNSIYDDIDIVENIVLHGNERSYAVAKGSAIKTANASAVWRGQIRFTGNWWRKSGDITKIFYARQNFADVWSGNIDLDTGAVI